MQIQGYIFHFNLEEWWLSTFTEAERQYIEEGYKPLFLHGKSRLTYGNMSLGMFTLVQLLSSMASWFRKTPEDRELARRMIAKAEQEVPRERWIWLVDDLYREKIRLYYEDRSEPEMLKLAIAACEQQVAIAPSVARAIHKHYPDVSLCGHLGFWRLARVREKEENYAEVIRLCQQAKQQGWAGNWDRRIERCQRRMTDSSQDI